MLAAFLVAAVADASLPDFGDISTVGTMAAIGTFIGGLGGLLFRGSLEAAETPAFAGLLIGTAVGLITYLTALIEGVL